MTNLLIKEAFVFVVGKQAGEIVEFLDAKKYVNEFLIAKKMDMTVNQIRNILYRLSDQSLVSSTRKKDKRKGWYTYFWKVEDLKALEFIKDTLVKKIEQLNNQIKNRETKNFYVCERCNLEFNEETALLYNFTCDECGAVFVMKDNAKLLNELTKQVDKLNKKLEIVDEEIKSLMNAVDKKREKEVLKEQKEKEKKKNEMKKERAKNKMAMKKAVKKKTPKKKVSKKSATKKKSSKKKNSKKK